MLDIKFIRENPKKVKEGAAKKGAEVDIDKLLAKDKKLRLVLGKLEKLLAEKNKATKSIAEKRGEQEKKKIIRKMQEIDTKADSLRLLLRNIEKDFLQLMEQLPNLPFDEVPAGRSEKDNIVVKEVGKKPKFNFLPKDYLAISREADIIDVKRAAKIAGSRFGFIKKEAALIEFALVNLAFDVLIKEGFLPIITPVMIKPEMAKGMGYLEQTGREEAYFLPKDNLFLIGTSEQAIGTMHSQEVFEERELPKRYAGFSTCFRREAGSYGKDTKGILRVHQFDKIEMFSFSLPEKSKAEHKFLLSLQEKLMNLLELPYQVVHICAGDMGRPAADQYDIETWIPSENRYRETHSTSNCTDFQSRRLNIRYRAEKDKKLHFVYTLNGTAFAIGRILIALLENNQQKDKVLMPKALWQYLSFKEIKIK